MQNKKYILWSSLYSICECLNVHMHVSQLCVCVCVCVPVVSNGGQPSKIDLLGFLEVQTSS